MARMLEIGVFSSCVTAEMKSARMSARRAPVRAACRLSHTPGGEDQRHDRRQRQRPAGAAVGRGQRRIVLRGGDRRPRRDREIARRVGGDRDRIEEHQRKAPLGARHVGGHAGDADDALAGLIDDREIDRAVTALDSGGLRHQILEVVLARPLQAHHEPEDRRRPFAERVRVRQQRHDLIARAAQLHIEDRKSPSFGEVLLDARQQAGRQRAVAADDHRKQLMVVLRRQPDRRALGAGVEHRRFFGRHVAPRKERVEIRVARERTRNRVQEIDRRPRRESVSIRRRQHELLRAAHVARQRRNQQRGPFAGAPGGHERRSLFALDDRAVADPQQRRRGQHDDGREPCRQARWPERLKRRHRDSSRSRK